MKSRMADNYVLTDINNYDNIVNTHEFHNRLMNHNNNNNTLPHRSRCFRRGGNEHLRAGEEEFDD
jgi:hypothetical protein